MISMYDEYASGSQRERFRLTLLAAAYDARSQAIVGPLLSERTSLLELGCGTGSMARFMADEAPDGQVVATELDVELCAGEPVANAVFIRHDVRTDEFEPASFDLIFARSVIATLPSRSHLLERLASWLRPAGVLVLQTFDFGPAATADSPLQDVWSAMVAGGELVRIESNWMHHCAVAIEQAGLRVDLAESTCGIERTGTSAAHYWAMSIDIARPFLEPGLLPDGTVSKAAEFLITPGNWCCLPALTTVIATRSV